MTAARSIVPRVLPPFPTGWYCVGLSKDLAAGQILTKHVFGRELVAWRTEAGEAVVTDAYCPHMGAHFGFGGCVEGANLRCPFHDFRFDAKGACVATGYGTKPPPKAKLRSYAVRENAGFVVAYFDAEDRAPEWELPVAPADGWSALSVKEWKIRSHPQETTENSVDLGHLSVVHKYEKVEALQDLELDGPRLHSRYRFERPRGLIRETGRVHVEIDISAHGFGWSVVETEMKELGLTTREYVLATPIDGEQIWLRVALQVKLPKPATLHPALVLLPPPLSRAIVRQIAFRAFKADVQQDFTIWENKIHVHPPALAEGDGPVGPYRRWAQQFYSETKRALPIAAVS